MLNEILCPVCCEISKNDMELYNSDLRKQNIDISPIYPTCKKCKSTLIVNAKCHEGEIIILNGTCGSGKTTIAEELMKKHGYYAIDGDCVIQSVKHKIGTQAPDWRLKVEFNSDEILSEIAAEIDYVSLFSSRIVLSHVILPQDIDRYIRIFTERNLEYRFYLLRPAYEEAVARCQIRTCHKSITPEYYVKYFYDKLVFSEGIIVVDNTSLSIDETIQRILFKRCITR